MHTSARTSWVAGRARDGASTSEIRSPYDARVVGSHGIPSASDVEEAVAAAHAVRREFVGTSAHRRASALDHVSARLRERREEIAQLISAESGKPIRWARVEVTRAVSTFRWAAEEARRWSGELQRLDTEPGSERRITLNRRVSRGVVLGIAPFNFPLNLVAHKVAPAIAVGSPIIVKPAPATPLTALVLGEILAEADLPGGSWSVLPVSNDVASQLVGDPRLSVISFTGSVPVGWSIRDAVPRKHVTLELGGNAAVVIDSDYDSPSDLERAAQRVALFAMFQGGQACISVQRVFALDGIAERFTAALLAAVERLRVGDPADEGVDVGPLIDERAAKRVVSWVAEAVDAGADLLTGGDREGSTVRPTVLTRVPADAKVVAEEIFGPVVVVESVASIDEAFARVNDSRFGLQAGVFSHDLATAFRAARELEVGGVIIGDVPSFRAD